MLLRWRPLGRCAASWITSGTVSGGQVPFFLGFFGLQEVEKGSGTGKGVIRNIQLRMPPFPVLNAGANVFRIQVGAVIPNNISKAKSFANQFQDALNRNSSPRYAGFTKMNSWIDSNSFFHNRSISCSQSMGDCITVTIRAQWHCIFPLTIPFVNNPK
jgi:hypothetical protein